MALAKDFLVHFLLCECITVQIVSSNCNAFPDSVLKVSNVCSGWQWACAGEAGSPALHLHVHTARRVGVRLCRHAQDRQRCTSLIGYAHAE